MKYIKTFEDDNDDKFKVGDYAIMLAANNKKVEILEVGHTVLLIDYDGHPMSFLKKGFITEEEYALKKYNL